MVSANTPACAEYETIAITKDIFSQMLLYTKEFEKDAYADKGAGFHGCIFEGLNQKGEYFVWNNMESLICGMGALDYRDGDNACCNMWTPKTQVANMEATEELFPVLHLSRKEAIDTGGAGKFRGGVANVTSRIP